MELLEGSTDSPQGVLKIERFDRVKVTKESLHPEGLRDQGRLSVMSFEGSAEPGYFPQPDTDWQLKASNPPYDSLAELSLNYRLGLPPTRGWLIEIVAGQVGHVIYRSPVVGTKAKPTVVPDPRLDTQKAGLGIRVFDKQVVIERRVIFGRDLNWNAEGNIVVGTTELNVPDGALVQCMLTYDGVAVHYGWLTDSTNSRNPRRALLEVFDPKLEVTSELLSVEPGRGRTGRSVDLERGTAFLAWLLGFSVIHLGADPRLSDAIDVVAVSPGGSFALIECTTGLLKAENKLANLVARAAQVRRALEASGIRMAKVYPIIISTRPREELKADLAIATQMGVLVIDRDDAMSALNV